MNNVVLMGRMTKDPETRHTPSQMCISRFTLAVDRRGKREEGKPTADFITCVAFAKTGEFVEKYGKKGVKFVLRGHIQTGRYEKDGATVFTTDVVVDDIEFAESKAAGGVPASMKKEEEPEQFIAIPDGADDSGLPWN